MQPAEPQTAPRQMPVDGIDPERQNGAIGLWAPLPLQDGDGPAQGIKLLISLCHHCHAAPLEWEHTVNTWLLGSRESERQGCARPGHRNQ